MTYDSTTFRDLMNRLSIAQTGSLNIFTSKEQEYEQRAQLLRRLAFVIFCSEKDQYHKYMPEIQGKLFVGNSWKNNNQYFPLRTTRQ